MCLIAPAVLLILPPPMRALPVNENFSGYTNGCNPGDSNTGCNRWTVSEGGATAFTYQTTPTNQITASAGGATRDVIWWSADSFSADHYAKVTVSVSGGAGYIGPAVRVVASGTNYHYLCGTGIVYKDVASSTSNLSTGHATCVDNDVVELDATGSSPTTLKLFINGVQDGADITDSSSPITSGSPGVGGYNSTGNAVTHFVADNLGGGGATWPPAPFFLRRCCR